MAFSNGRSPAGVTSSAPVPAVLLRATGCRGLLRREERIGQRDRLDALEPLVVGDGGIDEEDDGHFERLARAERLLGEAEALRSSRSRAPVASGVTLKMAIPRVATVAVVDDAVVDGPHLAGPERDGAAPRGTKRHGSSGLTLASKRTSNRRSMTCAGRRPPRPAVPPKPVIRQNEIVERHGGVSCAHHAP